MMRMRTLFQQSNNNNAVSRRILASNRNTTTMMTVLRPKAYLCLAVAAAMSTSAHAWLATTSTTRIPQPSHTGMLRPRFINSIAGQTPKAIPVATAAGGTRLYFSSPLRKRDSNSKENSGGGGGIGGFLEKVKSFLPTKWFGSKDEKEALQRKAEVQSQVSGGLNDILKDAPLPIRLAGRLVAPLMGSLASTLAESVAEQQRTTEALLDDARRCIQDDPAVADALGGPVKVGQPFSQSSSMASVNGRTQSRVELSVDVVGTRRSGVARVSATERGITQLLVESGGRLFNVNTSPRRNVAGSRRGVGGSKGDGGDDDDDIIEAEIIEKETKR